MLAAGLTVLLIWGTLYLVFRDWRARYRERAVLWIDPGAFPPSIGCGRSRRPMSIPPDGVKQWIRHSAMLTTVTGSNLLDVKDMDNLRDELDQHVARATDRPETAIRELADIWDEIADRGEFLFSDSRSLSGIRHPRPSCCRPDPGKLPQSTSALALTRLK